MLLCVQEASTLPDRRPGSARSTARKSRRFRESTRSKSSCHSVLLVEVTSPLPGSGVPGGRASPPDSDPEP